MAVNRGYVLMLVTTLSLTLVNLGIVLAASYGMGLATMALLTCGGSLLTGVVTFLAVRRSVGWWRPARPTGDEVRHVARYGAWINGWMFVTTLMLSTEVLMLSVLVGPEAVTRYTFSAFAVQFAMSMCLMTASALAPTIAASLGARRTAEAAELIRVTRELVLTIATMAASMNILGNAAFVTLWAGPEQFIGPGANVCISLAFLQVALIRCDAQILESGLSIRGAVGIGLLSSLVAIGTGASAYLLTGGVPWMIVGLIVGRLGMSFALPVFVGRLQPSGLGYPMRPLLASAAVVALSVAASGHLQQTGNLVLTVAGMTGLALAALVAIPSPDTLRRVIGRSLRR
ncbi:hypothetical protein Rumeso_03394 [Rubellimicrobium mesophilum DSM 19309]|uniref:Uncharacterized protein n=1 Tax=Rubellimicrobium mesophilum DSM 19309 TaxID=442562 RepID=A0A017HL59_9RHOB|nr:hypothetical protein [Rubellimicrobium mesophilum]EYD75066.1 hypothetical protein Rumeso_03394 [Rubellimicrobium mesophilum DSM 19309]